MSTDANAEPTLPLTPTNEGRAPSINNFGYNLAFPQLWAVGAGLAVGIFVSLLWLVGMLPGPWYLKIMFVMAPVVGGHIYTKVWIENALPHVQRDMIARFMTLRFDFDQPRWRRFPFIPSLRPDLTMCGEPEIGDGGGHPLLRLHELGKAKRRS
jgi:xanthosine utilization system XapX-like protein